MQPRDTKKNDEQGERAAETKYCSFEPFPIEAKNAETAILLLQSKEKSVILGAIKALSKYASKSKDSIKKLFDLDIVNNILPMIKQKDLYIQRFAAKLLVEIMVMPDVTICLIESNHLPYFANLLMDEKDTFMQEYFSAILAKLSKDPHGAALLAKHCSNMNFLFERMQSPDPDVKNNNMEILYNLMQDPIGARKILESEKFNLSLLYQYFESSHPEIQYFALNIVADIIGKNKNENVQFLFRKTNGIKALLNFLENDEWSNLHIEALKILNLAAENPATVTELIDTGSIPQILNYIEYAINSKLFAEALRIIVHIANTSNGRKVLHSHGIVEYLIDALERSTQFDVTEISCYGIGKIAFYNPAARNLANRGLIKTILDLLKKENLQWSTKHAASFALKQLLMSDIRNCKVFLSIHGQDYLLQLIKQSVEQITIEICIIVLEALIIIARQPTLRDTLINFDTIDTICSLLESTHPFADELKITCCNLLSVLCLEKDGRHFLLEANGPERLYSLVTDPHSIPIRNAAVQLIQTVSTDLIIARAFAESKYLLYMLNNRSSARAIPSWDTCIETLFKSHLSVKFALTGRLSLHDITQDGFYVLQRNVCLFPILDDIFRFKFCPLEIIYVVNCVQSLPVSSILENEENLKTNMNAWFESKFGRLQCDPHLNEYVNLFKSMLLATEPKDVATTTDIGLTNIQYVSSRAKMLACFVARQLSGFDPENKCIDHQLEIHLKEIKECLETSVIPLGQLRVGSYFERALLFKVIADRICLPTALVRGEYGISWVEIAVPEIEDSSDNKSFNAYLEKNNELSPKIITPSKLLNESDTPDEDKKEKISFPRNYRFMIYPNKLMKPNFIVDLMDTPGDLIPIGSPRSRLYCTKKLICAKICCH